MSGFLQNGSSNIKITETASHVQQTWGDALSNEVDPLSGRIDTLSGNQGDTLSNQGDQNIPPVILQGTSNFEFTFEQLGTFLQWHGLQQQPLELVYPHDYTSPSVMLNFDSDRDWTGNILLSPTLAMAFIKHINNSGMQ